MPFIVNYEMCIFGSMIYGKITIVFVYKAINRVIELQRFGN